MGYQKKERKGTNHDKANVVYQTTDAQTKKNCNIGTMLECQKKNCWGAETSVNLHKISPLTLLLLNTTCHVLANSADPDQLASEEANWSGYALFAIKYLNL